MNSNVLNTIEKIRPLILLHAKESLWGDVEKANRSYQAYTLEICKAFSDGYGIDLSEALAADYEPALQAIGAFYLLPYKTKYATSILKRISKSGSIEVSINSSAILKEWHKKALRFPRLIRGQVAYIAMNEL